MHVKCCELLQAPMFTTCAASNQAQYDVLLVSQRAILSKVIVMRVTHMIPSRLYSIIQSQCSLRESVMFYCFALHTVIQVALPYNDKAVFLSIYSQ
jgi:hypothetical protein